jgi:ACT domain-containing protein
MVDIDNIKNDFISFAEALEAKGKECGVDIRVMHEDIFNTMHKI